MEWVGILIAVGSFLFTIFAWAREQRARKADVAEERRLREEELRLQRERLNADLDERERQHHADITARQAGHESIDADHRVYRFILRNLGPSYSKHTRAWLEDDEGRPITGWHPGEPLGVGEELEIPMRVHRSVWEDRTPVHLMVAWFGEQGRGGEKTERSNLDVRL